MELEYIDNKKTMCWSKPDAVFAESPGDAATVFVPNLKDLPKMFNFPRETIGSTSDAKNDKNVLSVKKQNNDNNDRVSAPSAHSAETKTRSNARLAAKREKLSSYSKSTSIVSGSFAEKSLLNNDARVPTHVAAALPETETEAEPSSSAVYSGIAANATLKDLCPEDKQRVANLIQELAKLSADKEKSRSTLEAERKLFETQIKKLLRRHDSVLTEKQKLQDQYLECFKIVLKYQENLAAAEATKKNSVAEAKAVVNANSDVNAKADVNANPAVKVNPDVKANQRVDRDAQTDDSRDDDDDDNDDNGAKDESPTRGKTAEKDVSSCETQTSPALSRHPIKETLPESGGDPSPPPPIQARPPLPSQLYPRSQSPPYRRRYDQPPQSFHANDSRVFSNFQRHPAIPPHPPPTAFPPGYHHGLPSAFYNAVPLQMHLPEHDRLPQAAPWPIRQDWRMADPRGFLDPSHSAPYFVPVQSDFDDPVQAPPATLQSAFKVPPQTSALPPRAPAEPSQLPPQAPRQIPRVASSTVNSPKEFATPPLYEDRSTTEPKNLTAVDDDARRNFDALRTDPSITLVETPTGAPRTEANEACFERPASSVKPARSASNASSSSTRRKICSIASKSKPKPPSPDDGGEEANDDASSGDSSSTLTTAPDAESSTVDSVSTLRHLPAFKEDDSREKLMEIRAALKSEREKLETKLTKQEKYIRKKERELKRLAGKGKKKREEEGDEAKDVGEVVDGRNLSVNGQPIHNEVVDNNDDDGEGLVTSLNSGRSKGQQTNKNTISGAKLPAIGRKDARKVKTKRQLVDLVDSLESTDKESYCASWSQPLKSSTMIGEGGNGYRVEGGSGVRGGGFGVSRGRVVGSGKNRDRAATNETTRTKDRSIIRDGIVTGESERQNSSDQENELLDDIFFLH